MKITTGLVFLSAATIAALAGCDQGQAGPSSDQTDPTSTGGTVSGPGMNGVTDASGGTPGGTTSNGGNNANRPESGLEDVLGERDEPEAPASTPVVHPAGESATGGQPVGADAAARDIQAEQEAENVAARLAAERAADGEASGDEGLTAEMSELLGQLDDLDPTPITELEAEDARRQPGVSDAVAAWALRTRGGFEPEEVGQVENLTYPAVGGELPVRVYWPEGSDEAPAGLPVLVYWHGGGFVLADLNAYDSSARALANAADCIVVAPAYRHAPEAPFPAAVDDAVAAYQWVLTQAQQLGGDPTRVAVAGESAGGNLAAVVSLTCREQGIQMPVHQVLVYPVADWTLESPSYEEHASAAPLGAGMMSWFRDQYLGTDVVVEELDWRAAPLRAASFERLPPTTIITAQIDPLRSDGEMLAAKLQAAGVAVNHRNFEGVTHEFFGAGAVVPEAREAVQVAAADLKGSFGSAIGGVETDGE